MTPGGVLELLESRGVRLFIRDGFLKFRAPVGAYTDELRALVAGHRYAFIEEWRCWSCGSITPVLFGIDSILNCRACTPKRREADDGLA